MTPEKIPRQAPAHRPRAPWLEATELTVPGPVSKGGAFTRQHILAGVSLEIYSGELVAIVGPSGAGKSTLLRLLAGRASAPHGRVTLHNLSASQRQSSGAGLAYLRQDDILHGELEVRRALTLAAELRRPGESRMAAVQWVDRIMRRTQIDHLGHLPLDRLSGGERRRVNLCAELLSDFAFLLLDEPTSSLDPHHSREMLKLAREIADHSPQHPGVVVVTHDIWDLDLCDRVIFLVDGYLVFCGPPGNVLQCFDVDTLRDIFHHFEKHNHPARRYVLAQRAARKWARLATNPTFGTSVPQQLPMRHGNPATTQDGDARIRAWTKPGCQLWVLLRRLLANMAGDRLVLALYLAQPLIGALLVLILTGPSSLVQPVGFGLGAKQVVFTLVMVAVTMGLVNSHREIVREQLILQQEEKAGLGLGTYLLSKLSFLGVVSLVQIALLLGILSLGIEFPRQALIATSQLDMMISLSLCAIANTALGLLISSLTRTSRQAALLLVPVLTVELALGGLLFDLSKWPARLAQLLPPLWTFQALGTSVNVNQFNPYLDGADPLFAYTAQHLCDIWVALAALIVSYAGLAWISLECQRRVRMPRHLVVLVPDDGLKIDAQNHLSERPSRCSALRGGCGLERGLTGLSGLLRQP